MTLGSFYSVKRLGDKILMDHLYNATHYFDGKNIYPYLHYIFTLSDEELSIFIDDLGMSSLKEKPFELVSLLVYLNFKDMIRDGINAAKKIPKEMMEDKISSVKLTKSIHSNIINLLEQFGHKGTVLENAKLEKYFRSKPQMKDIYFCCYNIITYCSKDEVYNYEVQDFYYLANAYVGIFIQKFNLEKLSIDSLCRGFGVGKKLPKIISYSTLYKYFELNNQDTENIPKKLHLLNLYTDRVLIKSFSYDGDYNSRLDLMTKLIK